MRRLRALLVGLALVCLTGAPAIGARSNDFESGLWGLGRIRASEAWAEATGGGAVVAVVDSGIDWRHPEFGGGNPHDPKLVAAASCIAASEPSRCSTDPDAWRDRNGHGTHVAGVVAAPLDGYGVVGVAPDARLMPVRVLDANAEGSARDVAVGIRWAVAHGADVVNLSLAGLPVVSQLGAAGVLDSELARAIDGAAAAGVLVVAAAGNDAFPICSHKVFQSGRGVCVGASDPRDQKALYSNFGGGLDVVAPGGSAAVLCSEGVLSTHLATSVSTCADHLPGYMVMSGTSMAAPHVSGVGALLAERGVRGEEAAAQIARTTVDLGSPGYDGVYGYGRVDALRAVVGQTAPVWRPVAL